MRTCGPLYPEAPPRSKFGEVASWTARSDTTPGVFYTVRRFPDGHWECECRGYMYVARADGLCRHIDPRKAEWEAAEAKLARAQLGDLALPA